MGNELWQARIDEDFSERIHEYREENYMSKSELVRHSLRETVQQDQGDLLDEEIEAAEAEAEAEQGVTTHTFDHLLDFQQAVCAGSLLANLALLIYIL